MKEIKTKSTIKDIKMLDKAADVSYRAKNAFIRTKEQAEQTHQQDYNSSVEYAEDKIKKGAETLSNEVGHAVDHQRKKIVQKIKGRRSVGTDTHSTDAANEYTPQPTLNAEQMQYYIELIVGDIIEIPILLGGFYGMRRSECLGVRESQFDFKHKFFRASHTVTKVTIDNKKIYIPSDKLKTDFSNRTYPLIPYVEERIKAKITENKELRELCGNSYSNEWLGYICVHPLGEIIDPDYITNRHRDLLKKAGLPPIRFHDLRHSCVGLMMANEVPMERIRD